MYETIRVSKGRILFLDEHIKRLIESAKIIDIEHQLSPELLKNNIQVLVSKNEIDSCNIKVLLIGGKDADSANLYILCLNPLFPDRKLYKQGAKCITQHYERPFPHAKSLNMLQSYLSYRAAKRADAYDSLIVNRNGCIAEGTRTNFFAVKDRQLISAPADEILLGVTRHHILEIAKQAGFTYKEQDIKLSELDIYDGFYITNTSSKIMPIRQINDKEFEIPDTIRELMIAFDQFLAKL